MLVEDSVSNKTVLSVSDVFSVSGVVEVLSYVDVLSKVVLSGGDDVLMSSVLSVYRLVVDNVSNKMVLPVSDVLWVSESDVLGVLSYVDVFSKVVLSGGNDVLISIFTDVVVVSILGVFCVVVD